MGSGGESSWGGQSVRVVANHGRRARERNFVCLQDLASVSAPLPFSTNIFVSVFCESFLLLLMQVLITADGTHSSVLRIHR